MNIIVIFYTLCSLKGQVIFHVWRTPMRQQERSRRPISAASSTYSLGEHNDPNRLVLREMRFG